LPPPCILKWIKSIGRIKAGQQNCRNIRLLWFFSMYNSHTLCVTFLDICFFKHFASARCMCVRRWHYEKIQKARWKLSTIKKSFQLPIMLHLYQFGCHFYQFCCHSCYCTLLGEWIYIYTDKKRVCFFQGC
jgi:hypothetical protein